MASAKMKRIQFKVLVQVMFLLLMLLSSCGEATATPIFIEPPTETLIPPPAPRVVIVPHPTLDLGASNQGPYHAKPTATNATQTVEPSVTTPANPLERPFLMRIDRIAVIVGRGLLLQGMVTSGSLRARGSVEILGPQKALTGLNVVAVLIGNTMREQVKVGDSASILVGGLKPSDLSPGLLLVADGGYKSYEAAQQQLTGH